MCVNFRAPGSVARPRSISVASSSRTTGAARPSRRSRDGYDGPARTCPLPFPSPALHGGKATSSKVQAAKKEIVAAQAPTKPPEPALKGMVGQSRVE
jgi:hypothetical protein